MAEEQKTENTKDSQEIPDSREEPSNTAPNPAPEEVVVIKSADGEQIRLEKDELVILVKMDLKSGRPSVFNIQNCPLRALSKMLINEVLYMYTRLETANLTAVTTLNVLKEADKKKPLIHNPFKR